MDLCDQRRDLKKERKSNPEAVLEQKGVNATLGRGGKQLRTVSRTNTRTIKVNDVANSQETSLPTTKDPRQVRSAQDFNSQRQK